MDLVFVPLPNEGGVQDYQSFYSKIFGAYADYGEHRISSEIFKEKMTASKEFPRYEERIKDARVSVQVEADENYRKTVFGETELYYHRPIIKKGIENHAGYTCFFNRSGESFKMLFAVIPSNEEWEWVYEYEEEDEEDDEMKEEQEKLTKKIVQHDLHIVPFKRNILKLITSSHRIRNHMKTVDFVEKRITEKTNGTNARIKLLGYLSIFMLLLTSFAQTRYLKNFFRKKKVI